MWLQAQASTSSKAGWKFSLCQDSFSSIFLLILFSRTCVPASRELFSALLSLPVVEDQCLILMLWPKVLQVLCSRLPLSRLCVLVPWAAWSGRCQLSHPFPKWWTASTSRSVWGPESWKVSLVLLLCPQTTAGLCIWARGDSLLPVSPCVCSLSCCLSYLCPSLPHCPLVLYPTPMLQNPVHPVMAAKAITRFRKPFWCLWSALDALSLLCNHWQVN